MTNSATRAIRPLHPRTITSPSEIRRVMERARADNRPLHRGLNKDVERESATISSFTERGMTLSTANFERRDVTLRFTVTDGDQAFFFTTERLDAATEAPTFEVAFPAELHLVERREGHRETGSDLVRVKIGDSEEVGATLIDHSPGGMCLSLKGKERLRAGVRVEIIDGPTRKGSFVGEVRDVRSDESREGWIRIGVKRRPQGSGAVGILRSRTILPTSRMQSILRSGGMVRQQLRGLVGSRFGRQEDAELERVTIRTSTGDCIAAFVDRTRLKGDGPTFLLPPAWGRTKETLLPLARTLIEMFDHIGQPATVVRFDGIARRGESTNSYTLPGTEHHGFTISQAVRDILTVGEWARSMLSSTSVALVSFSASAIEARKALVLDRQQARLFSGWVSVVGPPDLQAAMRIVSGGIDYVDAWQKGVHFGHQEILGVEIDMDLANADAEQYGLATLDDAKSDFEKLEVPIVWLHGRFDAWMSLPRLQEALAFGRVDNRQIIDLPIAHQLRASAEALEVFQLIGLEAGRMLGHVPTPVVPDLADLSRRALAQRNRLPKRAYSAPDFWRDYLLGRSGSLGMELMLRTHAYQALTDLLVDSIGADDSVSILDLGAGTGAFGAELVRRMTKARVCSADLVFDALRVARDRQFGAGGTGGSFIQLDASAGSLPFGDQSFDAVVASLFLSYVDGPLELLKECARILRPHGRLIVSSLKPDADFSTIWVSEEPRLLREAEVGGPAEAARVRESLPSFFNSAAKVQDLEECGRFQFWSVAELEGLLATAGFEITGSMSALGEPPQALIVQSRRL